MRKYKTKFTYDYLLIAIVGSLLALGLLMVTSASIVVSDRLFHTPFHFFLHQLFYVFLGIGVGAIVIRIPLSFWEQNGGYLLLISILLLTLVLVPGIGREVNGSRRWFGIGPFGIEVSELAKFSVIVYLAGYLVRRQKEVISSFSGFLKPMVILGLVALLLLMEPDFGATTVIMATSLGMIFLAGARLRPFIILVIAVGAGMALLAVISPYRLLRLTSFLHPWADQFNSGYQLTQSLIAFGRGGIFGVGLGNSVQKLFYLPEAHTDFLFAVLAEELGLIGQLLIIGLFVFLVSKIFATAKNAAKSRHLFGSYMAYGFGLWLGLQALINIGVNAGMLPTKGLTLPFMSYGGSGILINCITVAVLLRIYHETTK
jgi:cell division protein FtsW